MEYLENDDGEWDVVRLPATGDPMLTRAEGIRERDAAFVVALLVLLPFTARDVAAKWPIIWRHARLMFAAGAVLLLSLLLAPIGTPLVRVAVLTGGVLAQSCHIFA